MEIRRAECEGRGCSSPVMMRSHRSCMLQCTDSFNKQGSRRADPPVSWWGSSAHGVHAHELQSGTRVLKKQRCSRAPGTYRDRAVGGCARSGCSAATWRSRSCAARRRPSAWTCSARWPPRPPSATRRAARPPRLPPRWRPAARGSRRGWPSGAPSWGSCRRASGRPASSPACPGLLRRCSMSAAATSRLFLLWIIPARAAVLAVHSRGRSQPSVIAGHALFLRGAEHAPCEARSVCP